MSDLPPGYPPSPYQQPSPYFGYANPTQPDLLAPARRAAMLMFVIAGLILLLATCLGVIGKSGILNRMPAQQEEILRKAESEIGISRAAFMTVVAVIIALPALVMIVVGLFVRKGGRGSIITSLILASLLALWLVINLASTLGSVSGADRIVALAMFLVAFALVAFLLQSLISALSNASKLRQMQMVYAAQWWQYQQQQQMYYAQQQQQQPIQPPPPPPQP